MEKIIIISNGLGIVYKFRLELLLKLKETYEIIVLSPLTDGEFYKNELEKHKITIYETKMERRKKNIIGELLLIKNYFYLLKMIKPKYTLLYTIKPNLYGGLICKFLKIKYINTITGLGSMFQEDNFIKRIVILLYKVILKNSYKVIFQNKDNLNFFLKKELICKKNTILVSGSGVNLDKFTFLKKLENSKKIKFLFIGRIMKEKGIEELIEIFDELNVENNQIELNVLGQFEEEVYKEILKEKSFINYLGITSDIREHVRNMDCIINPSWHEGMSNVLLEAGAMKKFLIASEIPGCKEIVLNNITGFTFEAKNKNALKESVYKYLSLKEDEKEKMIEKQYEHIKNNFSREKVINEYLKIINERS